MTEQLKNRIKSLLWRAGMMAVAVIVDGTLKLVSSGEIQLSPMATVAIGLVLGEVSKVLNSYLSNN